MPKEIINSRYYGQEIPAIDGGLPTRVEPTHLHVGWTKDLGHIEVAVLNTDPRPGDTSQGWFMQVDREGCNRAIRALRKARDDAFGRDE